jgi:hypothetical protein
MTAPMQISFPLALQLRTPVRHGPLTDARRRGESGSRDAKNYQDGFEAQDIFAIEDRYQRDTTSRVFASILRDIFNHPDWSELHAFFTKRYGDPSGRPVADEEKRVLKAPTGHALHGQKSATVHFRTDPDSVGLSSELAEHLGFARRAMSCSSGPDPITTAIGPAIGMAVGAGAYIDLVYGCFAPGKNPDMNHDPNGEPRDRREDSKTKVTLTATKSGGRGRTWAEWAELWGEIADWVFEHEAALLDMSVSKSCPQSQGPEPDGGPSLPSNEKKTLPSLFMEAIDAADMVHNAFSQLNGRPLNFQGIEWAFLELEVHIDVSNSFYARFGRKPDRDHFSKLVQTGAWPRPDHGQVDKHTIKACPSSFNGADWEAWLLSIEGGDVVSIETLFQVSMPHTEGGSCQFYA